MIHFELVASDTEPSRNVSPFMFDHVLLYVLCRRLESFGILAKPYSVGVDGDTLYPSLRRGIISVIVPPKAEVCWALCLFFLFCRIVCDTLACGYGLVLRCPRYMSTGSRSVKLPYNFRVALMYEPRNSLIVHVHVYLIRFVELLRHLRVHIIV